MSEATTLTTATSTGVDTATRYLPLAGVGYALLQVAGDLTIGDFPDGSTSPHALASYYADHHAQVAHGGRLMEWSAVLLGLFVVALWARTRTAGPWAVAILVGGTMEAVFTATDAGTYRLLGDVSTGSNLDSAALQAWHLAGSELGVGGGVTVMMLGVLMASLTTRAVPAWLAWSGMALGLAAMTPFGFLASLLVLLWCLVAGIVLTARPAPVTQRAR